MTRTVKTGYGILGALLAAAVAVVLVAVVLAMEVWQALALLAIADLIILLAGYRIVKRAARADQREGR